MFLGNRHWDVHRKSRFGGVSCVAVLSAITSACNTLPEHHATGGQQSAPQTGLDEVAPSLATSAMLSQWRQFSPPLDQQRTGRLNLWGTHYHAHTAEHESGGFPLLGEENGPLGPELSKRAWCHAALEGTAIVIADGKSATYNVLDAKGPAQVDCSEYFRKLSRAKIRRMGRSRFFPTNAELGHGVRNWRLIPHRTIAVDPDTISFGSVLFIPAAVGKEVSLPDGSQVVHDGYFFAGDRGSAIKGKHVDFFTGLIDASPFPELVLSVPTPTFEAFLVEGTVANVALLKMHKP